MITFLFSRSETTGTTDGGIFTIGEIASNMTQINNTMQYEVKADDRWIIFLDGIIVNGQSINGYSALLVVFSFAIHLSLKYLSQRFTRPTGRANACESRLGNRSWYVGSISFSTRFSFNDLSPNTAILYGRHIRKRARRATCF